MRPRKRTKRPETLSDYVARQMHEQGLGLREVESRSRRGGRKGIAKSTVAKIRSGETTNPSPEMLKALAHGLGRSEEEIFNIVLGKDRSSEAFEEQLRFAASGFETWTEEEKERFLITVRGVAAGIRAEQRQ
jgi:transcriptional regulator with XRE-family HTH domain